MRRSVLKPAVKLGSFMLMIGVFMMPAKFVWAQNSGFKPHGKMFAQFFGDYYYKMGGTSNSFSTAQYAKTPKNFNAFDIRRVYFGYVYNFTKDVSTKIELANEGNTLFLGGDRTFYLKNADIEIKNVVPYGKLIIGQQGTPTFATFTEPIWGYRSVAKTLLDMRHLGGSNDLGIALTGNFNKEGTLGYTVMIGNGSGAKVENNIYKKFYGEIHAKLFKKQLILEAYADYEGAPQDKGRTTLKGFAAYQNKNITVGLAAVKQWRKNAMAPGIDVTPTGLSIYARGSLIKGKLNGFARQDLYNPDAKNKTGYKEYFTLLGLDYLVSSHVHLMPNIWINSYKAQGNNLPSKKSDVVARVTWYFSF